VDQVRQGTPDGGAGSVTNMQVWVDKHTFLPLKTEVRDGTGAVLDRSEVTSVQYGVAIPDSTFQYSPPAGAQISTFTGGSGADVKRALYSGSENPNPKLGR
jgi:outer membrane lipoprotein-sorting protein